MTARRPDLLPGAFALLVVVVGVVATWGRYGPSTVPNAAPQLLAGWVIAGCGVMAWPRVPRSRVGPLLAIAGLATFLSDFSSCLNIVPLSPVCLPTGFFGDLAEQSAFLWTGLFAHALLGFPTGRPASRLDRAAVAGAYVAAVLPALWLTDGGPLVLTALLAGVLIAGWVRTDPRVRSERRPAVLAAVGVSLATGAIAITASLGGPVQLRAAADPLVVLELAAAVAAVGLLAGLLDSLRGRTAVTDLVIELGETRSGAVGDALALAIGDPTLQVGFLPDGAAMFIDGAGRPIEMPQPGSTDRTVLTIQRVGRPVAVLIHDPSAGDDPALRTALAEAVELAATNAALETEVRDQLDEVLSSRRRLLDAAVEERRELEERLHDGAERHLGALAAELSATRGTVAAHPGIVSHLNRAIEQLDETRTEVRELARGLHPRVLEERGLRGALTDLAERSPVPIELSLSGDLEPDVSVQATIYFVTSEALANVAKYAAASGVRISVEEAAGDVRVVIADDGVGGADPAGGSGLRGLRDRVEALGGTLVITSPPGHGTRLAAIIPSEGGTAAWG